MVAQYFSRDNNGEGYVVVDCDIYDNTPENIVYYDITSEYFEIMSNIDFSNLGNLLDEIEELPEN